MFEEQPWSGSKNTILVSTTNFASEDGHIDQIFVRKSDLRETRDWQEIEFTLNLGEWEISFSLSILRTFPEVDWK